MRAIAVEGTFAYLEDEFGVRVINVADPARMVEVGSWSIAPTYSFGGGSIELQGNRAFVLHGGIFSILDISNPALPVEVKQIWAGSGAYDDGIPIRFLMQDGKVFFLYASRGLWILDVARLLVAPTPAPAAAPLTQPVYLYSWAGHGNYLYTTSLTGVSPALAAQVVDVTEPTSPRVANYAPSVPQVIQGAYGYASNGGAFTVFSLTDPLAPGIIGTYAFTSPAQSYVVTGTTAYITRPPYWCSPGGCTFRGISHMIDLSDPYQPRLVRSSNDLWFPIAALGDYLYARGDNGIRILRASGLDEPVEVNVYTDTLPGFWTPGMQVSGNYGYLYGSGGLRILDLSEPANPIRAGALRLPVTQLALNGQTAYVLNETGVYAVDISDPKTPRIKGSLLAPMFTYWNIALAPNGMLFIGGSNLFVYELVEIEVFPRSFLPNVSASALAGQ